MEMKMMVRVFEQEALTHSVRILPDNAQLLEYGCGGSTLHFASLLKPNQHLTTVEHDPLWYKTVRAELEARNLADKVTFVFVPLEGVLAGGRIQEERMVLNGNAYLDPPVDWSAIRWVFVDGIMRGLTMDLIRTKLAIGTPVFLHDYTGRENWYNSAVSHYTKLPVVNTLLPMQVRNNAVWSISA